MSFAAAMSVAGSFAKGIALEAFDTVSASISLPNVGSGTEVTQANVTQSMDFSDRHLGGFATVQAEAPVLVDEAIGKYDEIKIPAGTHAQLVGNDVQIFADG